MKPLKVRQLCLELTNRCNINCVFCPIKTLKGQYTDIPFDLARKVISETKAEKEVSLALFGEPTLYERLPEIIGLIKVQSILYTNAIELDKNYIEEIFKAGLGEIVFSIDAFDREDYKRIKGIDHFDKVMSNLFLAASIKKVLGSNVLIIAKFAGLNYNTPQAVINKRVDELKKIVTVLQDTYTSWGGEVEWKGSMERKLRERKACESLFKFVNVTSNGDIVMCCIDYRHSFVAGNANDGNILDIWQNEKFTVLRERHLRGDLPDMCLKCEKKDYYE